MFLCVETGLYIQYICLLCFAMEIVFIQNHSVTLLKTDFFWRVLKNQITSLCLKKVLLFVCWCLLTLTCVPLIIFDVKRNNSGWTSLVFYFKQKPSFSCCSSYTLWKSWSTERRPPQRWWTLQMCKIRTRYRLLYFSYWAFLGELKSLLLFNITEFLSHNTRRSCLIHECENT